MVDRHSEKKMTDDANVKGAIVTDLDGTLINGNSLKWILKLGLKRLLRRGRIPSFLVVMTLGGMAALKIVSHETMKYGALRLFGDDPKLMEDMHRLGHTRRNAAVAEILAKAEADGDTILLASAASESYIRQIWEGEYLASPFGGPDLKGERKREAVEHWLNERDLPLKAFLTDHHADLPMARWAAAKGAKIYLVNPSEKTITRFREAHIPYIFLHSDK